MMPEQYQAFCEDYCRDNTLKWLCHSSQDQDKETSPMTIETNSFETTFI